MTKVHMMGVVNITPNSFSDSGLFLDLKKIKDFINSCSIEDILDFGAQSTAPFNDAISFDEEMQRITQFLYPLFDEGLLDQRTISIDTNKPHVMTEVASKLFSPGGNGVHKLIWNDVSGILDGQTLEVLKSYPLVDYVYSHNLAPSREKCNDHMLFVSENNDLKDYFLSAKNWFVDHQIDLARIIFDPCFGFSKTTDQNFEYIRDFLNYSSVHKRWLLGISKKSFLQALSLEESKSQRIADSEYFHCSILCQWMKEAVCEELIIRVHDPEIFKKAQKLSKLI